MNPFSIWSWIPLPYKIAAGVFLVAGLWGHGYVTRGRLDQTAAYRAENAALKKNINDIQTILAADNARARFSTIYVDDLKGQIDAYKNWSLVGASFNCNLDDERARRLSGIADAASRNKHSRPPGSP